MAIYNFDQIRHAGGTLKMTIITDDPTVGTMDVHGDYIVTFADKNEKVEESGFGGVLNVDRCKVDMHDEGGILSSVVFNRSQVTKAQAKLLLNPDGTDHEYIYGDIDLETLDQQSYHDDQAGHEHHSKSFVVFSNLRRLETSTPLDDLYPQIVNVEMGSKLEANGANYYIKIMTLLDEITSFLGVTFNPSAHQVTQKWTDGTTSRNFDELYLLFSTGGIPPPVGLGAPGTIWTDQEGCFLAISSLKELLLLIAQMFVSYPVIEYDPGSDTWQLTLKQREGGNVITKDQLGELKASNLKQFYGYDGILVVEAGGQVNPLTIDKRNAFPQGISDAEFAKLARTFTFANYLAIDGDDITVDGGASIYMKDAGGTMVKATHIKDGSDDYTAGGQGHIMNRFLLNKFVGYWRNRQEYVRTYRGTGIGGTNPVKVLDRLDVDGTRYTIVETKRNAPKNESTLYAVEFPLLPDIEPVLDGLVLWYKADAIVGLSDGDEITTWINSGTLPMADLGIMTGASGPIYKTNQLNGLPAAFFDGSMAMQMNGLVTLPAGGNYTVIVFYKFFSTDPADQPGGPFEVNHEYFMLSSTTRFAYGLYANQVDIPNGNGTNWKPGLGYGDTRDLTTYHYGAFLRGAPGTNDAQAYKDAVLRATVSPGTECSPISNLIVGSYAPTFSLGWRGYLPEIMVYNRKISFAELTRDFTYGRSKYALP